MSNRMPRYPNIEAERARAGLTMSELAEEIGVTRTTYSLWQNGKSQMMASSALALSRVLGKPVEYLLEDAEQITKEQKEA